MSPFPQDHRIQSSVLHPCVAVLPRLSSLNVVFSEIGRKVVALSECHRSASSHPISSIVHGQSLSGCLTWRSCDLIFISSTLGEVQICRIVFDKCVRLHVLFRKGILKSNAKGVIFIDFLFFNVLFSLLASLGLWYNVTTHCNYRYYFCSLYKLAQPFSSSTAF